MSISEKKAIIQQFTADAWNHGNMQVFEDVFTPNFVYHDPAAPNVTTLAEHKQFVLGIRTLSPDMVYTIEDIIAEGDKVVVRYLWQGTPQKEVYGIPPTGKLITHVGMGIYRFTGLQVSELWDVWDRLGVLQQLGAIPQM